jgi:hypothetical protein
MGSVASTNAGLADLLQNLTSASSPLASELSSPAMQSALQKAPAGDIVQLSNEALELQEMGTLFGNPSQTTSTIDPSTILAALYPSSATPTTAGSSPSASTTSSASTSSASPADQLASYENALQSEQVQTLFGITPTTTSNSLFNLVG